MWKRFTKYRLLISSSLPKRFCSKQFCSYENKRRKAPEANCGCLESWKAAFPNHLTHWNLYQYHFKTVLRPSNGDNFGPKVKGPQHCKQRAKFQFKVTLPTRVEIINILLLHTVRSVMCREEKLHIFIILWVSRWALSFPSVPWDAHPPCTAAVLHVGIPRMRQAFTYSNRKATRSPNPLLHLRSHLIGDFVHLPRDVPRTLFP